MKPAHADRVKQSLARAKAIISAFTESRAKAREANKRSTASTPAATPETKKAGKP